MEWKCPVCGITDDKEYWQKIRDLCKKHGMTGQAMNPGGRALYFDFGEIQLSDMCCACDYEKLIKWLNKRNKPNEQSQA